MREFVLTGAELLKFRDKDRFVALCMECPNYGKNYACPPVPDTVTEKIFSEKTVHVIIETCRSLSERDSLKKRLDIELRQKYHVVFSAGHCTKCYPCKRIQNLPCCDFLYSADISGIDFFALYEHLTGEKLKFDGLTLIYLTA